MIKDPAGAALNAADAPELDPIPIADLSRWLLAHIEDLRQLPAAGEAVDEIRAIIGQIERDTDRPAERWYAGRCACGYDLYARTGAVQISCHACGSSYDVQARRRELLDSARDTLATPTEISRAVMTLSGQHLSRDSINGYVRRKRLFAKRHAEDGTALYRVGDVLDLVATHGDKVA